MSHTRSVRPLTVSYPADVWAYSDGMTDPLDPLRLAVMVMAEGMTPLREMIEGEYSYFIRQGYTVEQARALSAAMFVGVFGAAIRRSATLPGDED